jgi:hypothetical protein
MFAGNTETSNTIIPHEASFLLFWKSNKKPKKISKNPLIKTNILGEGKVGGIITIKYSG